MAKFNTGDEVFWKGADGYPEGIYVVCYYISDDVVLIDHGHVPVEVFESELS